MTLRVATLQCA